MALDIEIDNAERENYNSLQLEFSEFNILVNALKDKNTFPILQRCLSNYFGDNEVFLAELKPLKLEVIELSVILKATNNYSMENFIIDFLKLIEKATEQRKTIKFIGD